MSKKPLPPMAKQKPSVFKEHGATRIDEYFWLRHRESDPDVMAYLEAENAYRDEVLKPHASLREQLWNELKARIKEDDLSVPVPKHGFEYYHRVEAGKQHAIHCRRRMVPGAIEEILLDLNLLAPQFKFLSLGDASISPDDQWMAYTLDVDGSEQHRLFLKNLATGQVEDLGLTNLSSSVEWSADSSNLFYVQQDESQRPYRLYRRDAAGNDKLIYEERDKELFLGLQKSKDERFLFLVLHGKITSEIRFAPADVPTARFRTIAERRRGHEYSVESSGNYFYILTNDQARNFKLCRAPIDDPAPKRWKEVIPHSEHRYLEDFEVFRDYLVVHELENGLPAIRIHRLKDGSEHRIEFPDPAYHLSQGSNLEFDSNTLRFGYSSLIVPDSVYDYDMVARTRVLRKRREIPSGYEPDLYASERIHARSHDGTSVPISLVYRKGTKRDGSAPLYLYGYGSYGISMPASFSSSWVSLVDRGFVCAIAHVRGGSELGRDWYEHGKFLKKKNTFLDFIACAEHLHAKKYSSSDRTAISGGSAGGLLMGAVINLRPELFQVAVAHVPFVDALNTMLDETLPLTALEYDEWGNPADKVYYRYIKSYSPYDNVEAKDYPHLLVTCGLNDPRVTYWEAAKWVAKLRALKTDQNRLVLDTNMDAGHQGSSGRYERLKLVALEQAFILASISGIGDK